MEWEGREESQNVEDRRGFGGRGLVIGGGGVGGLILIVILSLVFGVDLRNFLGNGGADPGAAAVNQQQRPTDPDEERSRHFSAVVLKDTEIVWHEQFRKLGKAYREPKLTRFSGEVDSACGSASAAMGPFYCPADSHVYLDLSFFRDMERKLNAPGDFARAYVIAHEVGHHVQHLLGYSRHLDEARRNQNKTEISQMSVRTELQADYLAGVWAHHADKNFHYLQKGDIESALNAANQIGDDRLQKRAKGYVVPDSFTHGTSKQRVRWFRDGFSTGDVNKARLLFDLKYNEL